MPLPPPGVRAVAPPGAPRLPRPALDARRLVMPNEQLAQMTARELRAGYESGALTPAVVVETVLGRIERLNGDLTAFVTVTGDEARQSAAAAERVLRGDDRAAEPAGALCGVPISIKDMVATKGVRTTIGSLLLADWVPEFDTPTSERLRAARAPLLGKTTTSEFGWKGDSGNRVNGPARNPWRLDRTAGGSSGGAAAAVAAGLGPGAIGSDGAGSVRIPAAFCGGLRDQAVLRRHPRIPDQPHRVTLAPGRAGHHRRRRGGRAGRCGRSRHEGQVLASRHRCRLRRLACRARSGNCASPGAPTWDTPRSSPGSGSRPPPRPPSSSRSAATSARSCPAGTTRTRSWT